MVNNSAVRVAQGSTGNRRWWLNPSACRSAEGLRLRVHCAHHLFAMLPSQITFRCVGKFQMKISSEQKTSLASS